MMFTCPLCSVVRDWNLYRVPCEVCRNPAMCIQCARPYALDMEFRPLCAECKNPGCT